MKRFSLLLWSVSFPACFLLQGPPRPAHASREEAAQVQFPVGFAEEGRQTIRGNMLRAAQLAMDDFLPWDRKPHKEATPLEQCLYRREAYDVTAAPGPEGIMFVSIFPNAHECDIGSAPIIDLGATYAIDIRAWRILAIQGE
ncbi:hypothetical protein POL68_38630 [Stigmatella sp. ncwal1]|uniref:Uncharacterized protein n=1 Tax=Stigmatella ashevillensis TaxID=2995309 RepID=A0ABT5DPY9_9BACT|nr:hypothetical protein [Stigmatella ashevillena]MDC0714436.1 hypothetical protein [Stigmatella ashevillena]